MSDRPQAFVPSTRLMSPRRLRRKALCLEAAVAVALVLSIFALLYVLSMDAKYVAASLY